MTKEELEKLAAQEIKWLIYYGCRSDREKLTIESDIYRDVNSIGYTKRRIPLHKRCVSCIITSKSTITKNLNESELIIDYSQRDKEQNKFTPLETYLIIYPDKKEEVISKIKNITEDTTQIHYGIKY